MMLLLVASTATAGFAVVLALGLRVLWTPFHPNDFH
jgi:hypothetical protein